MSHSAEPVTSSQRKFVYTVLCICICLFVILLLSELGLRIRVWVRHGFSSPTVDSIFVLDEESALRIPRPGYTNKGTKTSIEINSLGFRGDEISLQKPRNTIRIACLGASTTFCAEVSNNRAAWPHRLQEALQAKYTDVKVEVINAGIPGYVISNSLRNLQHRVLPLQPDLIIFYEANNDVVLDTQGLARKHGLLSSSEDHRSRIVHALSKYSLLVDLLQKNLAILLAGRDSETGKLAGVPRDLPSRFIGELDKIHHELKKRDIPLVLSTFLVKYRRDQERSVQIANANVSFWNAPWMTIDDLLDAIDYYNEAIVQYAHANQVLVVEGQERIPADSTHFADAMHLTDKGCALMAERFLWLLEDTGVIQQIVNKARQR